MINPIAVARLCNMLLLFRHIRIILKNRLRPSLRRVNFWVQVVHLVECCSVRSYLVTHNFLRYVGELGNGFGV